MSKRKRDGPTLLASKRGTFIRERLLIPAVCASSSHSSSDTIAPIGSSSILGKRSYENPEAQSRKRPAESQFKSHSRGQKRPPDFDFEIDRLHKRLRATTPTAEEAISFLLPHLLELRRLYMSEHQKVAALQSDNDMLKQNNLVITQTLRDQLTKKNLVQRQLDLALYRLSLVRDGSSF